MRENRTYGSEGGEGESPSLPLSNWMRRNDGAILQCDGTILN